MSEMKLEISQRGHLRTRVTKIYNSLSALCNKPKSELLSIKLNLEDIKSKLIELNDKIQGHYSAVDDSTSLESDFSSSESYDKKIFIILSEISVLTSRPDVSSDPKSLLKRPTAPLPTYESKDNQCVEQFIKEFEQTIAPYNYNNRDKLLLFKQQVTGRAALLFESLDLTKRTYDDAKQLLIKALSSKLQQKFSLITRLKDIKLEVNTDPFYFISEMTNIIEGVQALNLEVNDFLQFFFWCGMNTEFKQHLIDITNNLRPSLLEIRERFFEAAERYNFDNKKLNTGASVMAVNVSHEVKFKQSCDLCKSSKLDDNHHISRCVRFQESCAKVKKLKELNGCVRCGKVNHETVNCKFKLRRRCGNCRSWHFDYLCDSGPKISKVTDAKNNINSNVRNFKGKDGQGGPGQGKSNVRGNESESSVKKTNSNKETTSGLVVVSDSFQSSITGSDNLLPTFTSNLNNGTNMRVMMDTGCQSTFVSEKFAEINKCKVLREDVNLTINGFNFSKNYNSKLVEVECSFGDEVVKFEAFTKPIIDIKLNVPGLRKLINCLLTRNFKLADFNFYNLSDDFVSDIDLVLGTNSIPKLDFKVVKFGQIEPSIMFETKFGHMLLGNVEELTKNIYDLQTNVFYSKAEKELVSRDNVESFCLNASTNLTSDETLNFPRETRNYMVTDLNKINDKDLDVIARDNDNFLYKILNYEPSANDSKISELNKELITFSLEECSRNEDGRLKFPLLWNEKLSHLLGKNYQLSRSILNSNLKKYRNQEELLNLMDEYFKEQESSGVIERINDIDLFISEHPQCSFIPHMPIFKLKRDSTKCRIVYLSNLCENNPNLPRTVSHNGCMYPGPSLNQKLSTALLHLRFGRYLLVFDIQRAFNQILLNDNDQVKLLFLWFRNIEKKDFSIVAYKHAMLPFGLRCSPTILMLALYKILVLDVPESDPLREVKNLIYQCFYVDNGAYTHDNHEKLAEVYRTLPSIFSPYKMSLQQYVTNCDNLQNEIDSEHGNEESNENKLLGLIWHRNTDQICTRPIKLDSEACTKRLILQSLASNFDLYNINAPITNRAKLFMHQLQIDKKLDWDTRLPENLQKEWKLISNQANSAPPIKINRCVGSRNSSYDLVAFVDSSKSLFGVVIYIQDLETNKLSLVMAKNRVISNDLSTKSMPVLELTAIAMGTEVLVELYNELCGSECLCPLNILNLKLYSDSLVALSWIGNYFCKLEKIERKTSVFVMNKLKKINELCNIHAIKFSHVVGNCNPSDKVTRCVSYNVLIKTNYITGPSLNDLKTLDPIFEIELPYDPSKRQTFQVNVNFVDSDKKMEHLIDPNKFSSFDKLVNVHAMVLKFINKITDKVKSKNSEICENLNKFDGDLKEVALRQILRKEQAIMFPEIIDYFERKTRSLCEIPNLVKQLNLRPDNFGILRVESKFSSIKKNKVCPILLSRDSKLTENLIMNFHFNNKHLRIFSLMTILKKEFWIPKAFQTVKRILSQCLICRRFNNKAVKLNQNDYRDERVNPNTIPFSNVYLDYCGPFSVKINDKTEKVYILCITCMYTRAINLKLCRDLSTENCLRSLQIHVFDFGLPQYCVSDLGTQLVAAGNVITDFLKDFKTQTYFKDNNIKCIEFSHYYKGNSSLGGLVESCIKLIKHLIQKSIRNTILEFLDFEFLMEEAKHLINKRPITCIEALRSDSLDIPEIITPEKLLHGYELNTVNIVPQLQVVDTDELNDPAYNNVSCKSIYSKLHKVRTKLFETYHSEFLQNLLRQATEKDSRYIPKIHVEIKVNDIVLIIDEHCKPVNYPLGRVVKVYENSIDEVTHVEILKGKTGQVTKRHVSSIIPYFTDLNNPSFNESFKDFNSNSLPNVNNESMRQAAKISREKTKLLLTEPG